MFMDFEMLMISFVELSSLFIMIMPSLVSLRMFKKPRSENTFDKLWTNSTHLGYCDGSSYPLYLGKLRMSSKISFTFLFSLSLSKSSMASFLFSSASDSDFNLSSCAIYNLFASASFFSCSRAAFVFSLSSKYSSHLTS